MTPTELITEAKSYIESLKGSINRLEEILYQLEFTQGLTASANPDLGLVEPDPIVIDPSAVTASQVAGNENEALQDEAI